MAEPPPSFSETFRQRFSPRVVDRVIIVSVRGRPTAEDFENLRVGVKAACDVGWCSVVCDVGQLTVDSTDVEGTVGDLVRCYTALGRVGAVFTFLHAQWFIRQWYHGVMTPPPGFETERAAGADGAADPVSRLAATSETYGQGSGGAKRNFPVYPRSLDCVQSSGGPHLSRVVVGSHHARTGKKPHPDRPTALPRQPQPGEEVWRLRDSDTGRVQTCELRDNSGDGAGWEVQILEAGEILVSRRFENEREARHVAESRAQGFAPERVRPRSSKTTRDGCRSCLLRVEGTPMTRRLKHAAAVPDGARGGDALSCHPPIECENDELKK